MPPKDREPSPEKRKAPSPERGWETMKVEAYTLEPKRAKRQIATGADPSKSGAQAGPSTATSDRTSTHTHHLPTGHSRAITERGGTTKEWADEHDRVIKLLISKGCIRRDMDKVFDLLRPRNEAVAAHASRIAADIAGQLDSLVLNNNEKGVEDIPPWIAPPSPHEAETTTTNPKATELATERGIYPCIIACINFVAKKLQDSLLTADRRSRNSSPPPQSLPSSPPPSPSSSSPTPIPTPPRLIYACTDADAKPESSDGGTMIDVGLVEVSPDGTLANVAKSPSYYELFAIIEAKRSVSKENRVFEQLLVYTRQLYASQHDRRFAW
ncbi:hypothetical protein EV182_000971, partial [Spiromyces aspiralis]